MNKKYSGDLKSGHSKSGDLKFGLFEDGISNGLAIAMVPTIQKPDH